MRSRLGRWAAEGVIIISHTRRYFSRAYVTSHHEPVRAVSPGPDADKLAAYLQDAHGRTERLAAFADVRRKL